jgi:solute carrier family 25 folate transporter 32
MQVIESKSKAYGTMRTAILTVIHTEGAKGLYRGLVPAVIASSGSWGGYFYFYEYFKKSKTRSDGSSLGITEHVIISFSWSFILDIYL